jgi:hypothetical protein
MGVKIVGTQNGSRGCVSKSRARIFGTFHRLHPIIGVGIKPMRCGFDFTSRFKLKICLSRAIQLHPNSATTCSRSLDMAIYLKRDAAVGYQLYSCSLQSDLTLQSFIEVSAQLILMPVDFEPRVGAGEEKQA